MREEVLRAKRRIKTEEAGRVLITQCRDGTKRAQRNKTGGREILVFPGGRHCKAGDLKHGAAILNMEVEGRTLLSVRILLARECEKHRGRDQENLGQWGG